MMKKLQSSLLNMVLVLTGVAVIMGCILAAMNDMTSEPIALQEKKALEEGIQKVMGGQQVQASEQPDTIISLIEKNKTFYYSIYQVKDSTDNIIGAAVQDTVNGFGGQLVVLVGFDNDGIIKGYTLLKHAETPGLGAKADEWFKNTDKPAACIVGRNAADSLYVTKDNGNVEAITASTITSRAFLLAVNNAYKAYRQAAGQCNENKGHCCGKTDDCEKPCCQQSNNEVEPKEDTES